MKKLPKVLVVEDNDFVRHQLAGFLSAEGFAITETKDGEEAMQAMNEEDIGLAVVDLRMQPMDGMDFIRCLNSIDKYVPVIVVTGCDTRGLEREAVLWGVNAILEKPVARDMLVQTVEQVLNNYS